MTLRRIFSGLSMLVVMGAVFAGCSGIRPIQKGDTVRCPSCGAEFKIEEGMKHEK